MRVHALHLPHFREIHTLSHGRSGEVVLDLLLLLAGVLLGMCLFVSGVLD